MGRLKLHGELLEFLPNVYFQPPSNIIMTYPCIVYHKSGSRDMYSNDDIYLSHQQYKLTVIDRDPDSEIADRIKKHFQHCSITGYYTVDNLNHTSLTLNY